MGRKEELLCLFGGDLRKAIEKAEINYEDLQEIYIKTGQPVLLLMSGKEWYMKRDGSIHLMKGRFSHAHEESDLLPTAADLTTVLEYACNYSVYAHTQEIRQGYLTVKGGHRIGVAGEAIINNGQITGMRNISFLTVRVAHAIYGCGNELLPQLIHGGNVYNTLILSPPGYGKTTLLRDCIRQLSDGTRHCAGKKVGVVDERSEIAASFRGVPQHEVGIRTTVLDACPKDQGLMMLIRSMSPEVVAADEIGGMEETRSIRYAMNCGCRILCTMHASSVEEVLTKPATGQLVEEHAFERFVLLKRSGKHHFYEVYDEKMMLCNQNA